MPRRRVDLSPAAQYEEGYEDGYERGWNERAESDRLRPPFTRLGTRKGQRRKTARRAYEPKRTPNRWNKYVAKKGNSIRYKSGAQKGKLNLGAMATKYRKKYKLKKGKK